MALEILIKYVNDVILISFKIKSMKTYLVSRFFIVLCLSFVSVVAMTQATRTWVSGVGDDVNPCSRTAPCKTFAGAISKTATGGEINVIDPGGFGSVTITKSITIDGGGVFASILSSGTTGIIINAPDAVVIIRRLSINGAGTGITGIRIMAAKKVTIEDCYIANFLQKGIEANTTTACTVIINNVTIHNADDAIAITNSMGNAIIDGCKFQSTKNAGINVLGGTATVSNSAISDCKAGITAGAGTTVCLSNNVISYNNTALQGPGKISSSGNNFFSGNQAQGITATVVKLQ